MALDRRLLGRRIAVLAADGFDKIELTTPVAALRAACADVEIVSLQRGRIRGVDVGQPAVRVAVDRTLDDADPRDYDALLVPGGAIGPDVLRQSKAARAFAAAFDAVGKPIATLGHGACLLASAVSVSGRTLTSWSGIRDDLLRAGAIWVDQGVVRDGNWLTGRGAQDLDAFPGALVDHFAGTTRDESALGSAAPAHRNATRSVLRILQRAPRLSLGAATVAVALLVLVAMRARQRPHTPALGWS